MKPTPVLVIFLTLNLLADFNLCTAQYFSFHPNRADSLHFKPPQIFAEAHLLFGGEVSDLFNNEKTVITGTPLWKTDIRFGVFQEVVEGITSFISIRDHDYPQTNQFTLYEAGVKASHSWGYMLYGQTRLQAGDHSLYLNNAFDRQFWDRALIYDYLFRGARSSIRTTNTETELFFGTGQTSFFLWGGKWSLFLMDGLTTRLSGIYVARDNQYAAFGPAAGIEIEEKVGSFYGYQVIGYKNMFQEPSRIKELTAFAEGRFLGKSWELGLAGLFRRMEDKFRTLDEIRLSSDAVVHVNTLFSPGFQVEYFEKLEFSEVQYGIFIELNYGNEIRIVPRFRYTLPETGSDIGFLGLECHFTLGERGLND